jgi:large subunit ribosomal protein L10e
MASLRKGSAYSKRYARPYTRVSRKRTKNFIKSTPQSKIAKFNMGNVKAYQEGKFNTIIKIISEQNIQIRDHAIEAARQSIHRKMEKQIPGGWYLEVRVYPHHILRENKMLTGAGSDRMQTGMQKSFGKIIGRAAMVKKDQEVLLLATNKDKLPLIRKILKPIKPKLPCKTKFLVEKVDNNN